MTNIPKKQSTHASGDQCRAEPEDLTQPGTDQGAKWGNRKGDGTPASR